MNKKILTTVLAIVPIFSVVLAGCSLFVDSASDEEKELSVEGFSIETGQEVYLAEEGDSPLEITYAYVNEAKQAFYLGLCTMEGPPAALEKLVDGEWILAYSGACHDLFSPPIKIGPGASHEVTFLLTPSLWDPARADAYWHGGDIEGIYRIRGDMVYGEWDEKKFDDHTLPSTFVISNEFEIRRAP